MKNPPQNTRDIGLVIGNYFLSYFENDYQKTGDYIRDLSITDIQDNGNIIVISTSRPGLLIGRKGIHIEGLTKTLNKKIEIIESFSWADIITPVDWMAELEMEQETKVYIES